MYCGCGNFRHSGAAPPVAGLYGLASRDWRLVGTNVGELDRTRRRWCPRYLGVGIRSARRTLKIETRYRLTEPPIRLLHPAVALLALPPTMPALGGGSGF